MPEPSLEQIRKIVEERKKKGETVMPSLIPGPDVAVDNEGKVVVVEVATTGAVVASRPVSQVPKDTFASDMARYTKEQSFVKSKMPSNTYRIDDRGVEGWVYSVKTGSPYFDAYTFFMYFDSGYYYVKLIEPDEAGKHEVTRCHLFPDGKLCLSMSNGGGYSEMGQTYSKSVIWAKGFSEYLREGSFPFVW
ncbi:MAG: hypothetical protein C4583_07295 [Anaerolineaceae bacterium]|nr:MAG: hypothetical protein C4583_07295 [Anaerolineaceae bacterium]